MRAFELAQGGATDFELSQEFGVTQRTIYNWKAAHPEFAEACKLGKEAPDYRVEASMYHRAVGYSYASVKILQNPQNGGAPYCVPIVEHVPPDVGAQQTWLYNRRAEKWKPPSQKHQHVGKDDGPIQHTVVDTMTDDELESIARRGRPAPPEPKEGTD